MLVSFLFKDYFSESFISLLDLGRAPEVFLLSVKMHFYDNYNNGNRLPLFYKVGMDS